jgi:indolepyruvate decarboxylase
MKKRPVYIEINMGIWNSACPMPAGILPVTNPPGGTEQQLAMTIVGLIRSAQSPLILIGTEIQRYGLADKVSDLISKLGVRWATALLAKSTLAEQGAGWIGVYDPPHSHPAVQSAVENADILLTLAHRTKPASRLAFPLRTSESWRRRPASGAKMVPPR